MMADHPPMVWVDVETTGLEPELDKLLEIALVVTGDDLEPYAAYEAVVGCKDFGAIPAAVWTMHTDNGLLDECRRSTRTYASIDADMSALLGRLGIHGYSPMCGSSVHFDRKFVKRFFPRSYEHFHYHNIDVSSLKELAIRWAPTKEWPKKNHHRAMLDILESIKALRHYRSAFGMEGE